jgi:uroporphyrinogen decarboxylase
MRQAGRYMKEYRELRARHSFLEMCRDPGLAAEVTVQAATTLGVDAAILFSDILLILTTMGLKLDYVKGEGPCLEPALRSLEDFRRLSDPVPEALDYVYQAVRLARAALPPQVPLIGFAGAPFTLASYMVEGGSSREFAHTKALMYRHPEQWHQLLERLARGTADYLCRQIEAGCQAVQLFDSWVGCLAPDEYREFVLPHSRTIFASLPPGVPSIHFGRGTGLLLEAMLEAGGSVMGIDFTTPLDDARRRLGPVAVQGNLDPAVLLAERPYIRRRADRVLEQAGWSPGHIFNLGHGVLPMTPVDNVKYLVDVVHELSRGLH